MIVSYWQETFTKLVMTHLLALVLICHHISLFSIVKTFWYAFLDKMNVNRFVSCSAASTCNSLSIGSNWIITLVLMFFPVKNKMAILFLQFCVSSCYWLVKILSYLELKACLVMMLSMGSKQFKKSDGSHLHSVLLTSSVDRIPGLVMVNFYLL